MHSRWKTVPIFITSSIPIKLLNFGTGEFAIVLKHNLKG